MEWLIIVYQHKSITNMDSRFLNIEDLFRSRRVCDPADFTQAPNGLLK